MGKEMRGEEIRGMREECLSWGEVRGVRGAF